MTPKRYRVKPGRTFGPGGTFPAGSVVLLDPAEAEGFLDKLIPLDVDDLVTPDLKNELNIKAEPLISPEKFDLTNEVDGEAEPLRLPPEEDEDGEIDLAGTKKKKAGKGKNK